MGLILSMSPRALEKVLYFASYVVLDPGDTELQYKQLLTEKDFREAYDRYGNAFKGQQWEQKQLNSFLWILT